MEEKAIKTTPLSIEDLDKATGGLGIVDPASGSSYMCCNCLGKDFLILNAQYGKITVRCKKCNTVSFIKND